MLSQDTSRCPGADTDDGIAPQCVDCRRRTEPPAGEWQVWTLPPLKAVWGDCHLHIAPLPTRAVA